MATSLMPEARQRYYNNDGTVAAGCKLYTYAAGTSTPKTAWTDSAGTIAHANPIVLDSKGEAVIFWEGAYKVNLKTAAGVQITGYPVDNYVDYHTAAVAGSGWATLNANTFTADQTIQTATFGRGGGNVASNTAAGVSALLNNSTGSRNVAVGNGALDANTIGSGNIAVGDNALGSNTEGNSNTAVGDSALLRNTTGERNVAVGSATLLYNTTGVSNTAVGADALLSNTSGAWNVAVGSGALDSNTIANNNTAVGGGALGNTTTGGDNTAVGSGALGYNTGGVYNTAVGSDALSANTVGSYNTANGSGALKGITTGSGNCAISPINNAGTYLPVFNPVTENNRFCAGSTSVTNAYINVAWTVVSDIRDKTEISDVPHGLDFVMQMKTIAYRRKTSREDDTPSGPVRYGFSAQQILGLEGDSPVIVDAEDSERLRLVDSNLMAVLVNAIKELKAEVEQLKRAAK